MTASGGGGSRLNPSSLLATERFGAGQGMGAGCTVAGEEQSPPGLERQREGGKEKQEFCGVAGD